MFKELFLALNSLLKYLYQFSSLISTMALGNFYRATSVCTHFSLFLCLSLRLKLNKFAMLILFWYHSFVFLLYWCRATFTLVTVYISSSAVFSNIAKQKIEKFICSHWKMLFKTWIFLPAALHVLVGVVYRRRSTVCLNRFLCFFFLDVLRGNCITSS